MTEQLRADAIALWGPNGIERFDPAVSDSLGLPGDAVRLLAEVGAAA